MYTDTLEVMAKNALKKKEMLDKSIARYLLHAALAGCYVGIGIVLILTVGEPLLQAGSPLTMTLMGVSFGIALTLVIFAGSDLFTGNNMYFTIGALSGATKWKDAGKNWVWCWIGNLLGATVFCLIILGSGVFSHASSDHMLFYLAAKKMNLPTMQLFFRGILCNWLVCLSIWTATRAKEDTAKLILIFWMLFAFITSGYEHSVANMTVLTLALMLPHPETITIAGWVHNLSIVTLGNIVGGALFVGTMYWLVSPIKTKLTKGKQQEERTEKQQLATAENASLQAK
ncbi:formate/nitrite transporter family protein [Brevibacillus laterosporus]|uniref:formate/nitrite transporter family protein n=1 Tax=Brevibacillus laterosporus TaxID=1465 RepID=UPI000B9AA723|nr:formate/nitrite transporter family protein [Brevibacillus laterosporus]MCG7317091.1 formate/nitrite transporter family protein [Brevibacillus laterosporus]